MFLPFLADNNAASLTKFAKSAPENPGVPRAKVFGITSEESGTFSCAPSEFFLCQSYQDLAQLPDDRILPGLNNAGSKTSGRFVAATKITPSFVSKPSISTRS